MTSIVAVRHVAFEDLGILGELSVERGWPVTYLDAPLTDWPSFDAREPDILVVLGGPIGANDEKNYPFLTHEIAAIKQRLDAGKPTLGICLGAQLIARALGARVFPAPEKEIGWKPLLLSGAGYTSAVRHLNAEHCFMFHWHGDTFELPDDAVLLAGTETCPHQVFNWHDVALAFQCHPEVRAADLEKWFVGHAVEIEIARGVNVPQLRSDAARYGADLERQGRLCFSEWLDKI
ncbi:MAG: glutamine amidotransferase [Rhodospirillaceae bacterium]